jgi:hypothetical protein
MDRGVGGRDMMYLVVHGLLTVFVDDDFISWACKSVWIEDKVSFMCPVGVWGGLPAGLVKTVGYPGVGN